MQDFPTRCGCDLVTILGAVKTDPKSKSVTNAAKCSDLDPTIRIFSLPARASPRKDFAVQLVRATLLNHGKANVIRRSLIERWVQNGCKVTSMMTGKAYIVESLMEDVFSAPTVQAIDTRLMNECESRAEFKSISLDGQYSPCTPIVGQATYRASKELRDAQARADEDCKYVFFTGRGRTGAVFLTTLL
jgi:hypothetical protein